MLRGISSCLGLLLVCLIPASLAIKFHRYGYCLTSTPCSNIPKSGLVDDWVLLLTTAPSTDNGLNYWGPTFTGCDSNTINGQCTNQGIAYLTGDDTSVNTGFSYGFNSALNKWTFEKFVTNKVQVPGTDNVGYETFVTEYITVENDYIFQNGQYVASSTNVTVNPFLRQIRWVLLDSDQNESYRLLMSCENADAFLYNGFPQISLYVKRSALERFKVNDFKQLAIYSKLVEVLNKQKVNIEYIQWKFIPQDRPCPNAVVFNSFKWDSCTCQISGTETSFKTSVRGYY